MRNFLLISVSVLIIGKASSLGAAGIVDKEAIPEKILAALYKKHPDALEITARPKKHFGQDLHEIFFKDGEETLIELYKAQGIFYVNGALIDPSGIIPPGAFDNLKAVFGNYEIKRAILVVNPNGLGEEFDLIINSSGSDWNVSIDGDGKIIGKEPQIQ